MFDLFFWDDFTGYHEVGSFDDALKLINETPLAKDIIITTRTSTVYENGRWLMRREEAEALAAAEEKAYEESMLIWE